MPAPFRAALTIACAAVVAQAQAADIDVLVADATGKPLAGAVVTIETTGTAPPVKPLPMVEVAQRKRAFQPQVTVVTVGTLVAFPNFDTVRHQVYSFSPVKTFELKLYAGVPSAPIAFDKPGIVTMGCNIHDRMAAWVVVVDTPWHAVSGDTGRAHVGSLPAGSYRIRVWHPGLGADAAPVLLPLRMGATGQEQAVQLPVAADPLGKQT